MTKYKNPMTHKYVDITDEEEEMARELCRQQPGLFFHGAIAQIRNTENSLLNY